MMKMDPENKNSKVKHFQIIQKQKINGDNIKGDNQRQKKISKTRANNGKKYHACDSSKHLIKTCTKQRNIFVTYKERREITERDMTNIMEEHGTIKRLKVRNKIHANNDKALIFFETKEEAQRVIADINQYPGWKASRYYSRYKIQENQEKGPSDTNNSAEKKNRKKIQTNYKKT